MADGGGGRFEGGHKKLGGRPKGVPNKFTASIRDAFREAFDRMGGVEALIEWGKGNPDDFYKLISRLIPVQAEVKADGNIKLTVSTGVPKPEEKKPQ